MKAIDIIKQIQNTSKTKEKEAILKQSNCEDLKEILRWTFNPHIVTGIDVKKLNNGSIFVMNNFNFKEMFEYLAENNTGTGWAVSIVKDFILRQPTDEREIWTGIFTKTLKIGMTAKGLNKVYGKDFIPLWEIQQAYPIDKYPIKDGTWFSVSQKLNGARASFYRGKLLNNNGAEIKGFDYIIDAITSLLFHDWFLDGELIRDNTDDLSDNENFRIGTGIINSQEKVKDGFKFVIFDMIPINVFDDKYDMSYSKILYSKRLLCLKELKQEFIKHNIEVLDVVDILYTGTDVSQIDKCLKEVDAKGLEGCMVNLDVPYKKKRHSGILKVKSFKTCDIRCIDIEAGKPTGKYANTLGNIVCLYKGNPVGVSGFTDAERDLYWNNPDLIIGKIVQVKYKDESENKKGGISIQFPQFEGIREDKDTESYN